MHWFRSLESKVEERTKELLAARAEVAQGEKLASIGVLAAGIAHELNNPLTGVLTFTSLMRKKVPEGSEDAEDLDLVIRETKRCASIIRRLLDFAREKVPVKGFFNLNQVVEDTVRFVERPASLQQIEIIDWISIPNLPQVWGDADLIKQVVLNILVNAQQAIEGHGTITVASRSLYCRKQLDKADDESLRPWSRWPSRTPVAAFRRPICSASLTPSLPPRKSARAPGWVCRSVMASSKPMVARSRWKASSGEGTTFRILLPVNVALR